MTGADAGERPKPARPAIPTWAAPEGARPGLERALDHLDRAIEAAGVLGIATGAAESVRDEALARLGFPADVYVLAFVGGTGVGKSSLLNALAGEPVSTASVRRPTTDQPVAWVPAEARDDLAGLLAWLGLGEVREHDGSVTVDGRGTVAILDLPDMDSVEPGHRERVEELLPRVDAVAWVTDPEKYHDAVLHDDFLRRWVPRLEHQAIVVNKADRLDGDAVERIRKDLQRDLSRELAGPAGAGASARGRTPVLVTAANPGEGSAPRLGELREWLGRSVEAKRIVRARLLTSIVAAIDDLALEAGVDPRLPATPLVEPGVRRSTVEAVTSDVLRAIDLPGLEAQAVAATRARARSKGTGPVGLVTSAIYRFSGREARVADPNGFLVRWRDRTSLAPAVESVRGALAEPIREAPPAVRPVLAASVEPGRLRGGLEAAVDRAVARHDRTVPTSAVWSVIGLLQTLATAALVLSVAWIVLWVLARPPVDTVVLPLVGQVPAPLVALAGSLVAGYVVARLLGLHAGWVGRRWARRLRANVRSAVEEQVRDHTFDAIERLEIARRALWTSARAASEDTRRR